MDDLAGLSTENLNIRYLVWKVDPDPGGWVSVLHTKASFTKQRARQVLEGDPLSDRERFAILEGFDADADSFGSAKLMGMSNQEIVSCNMVYLIGELPQGEQKKMAKYLGVTAETVSRWSNRNWLKERKNYNKIMQNAKRIAEYLGVKPRFDLSITPLFLSLIPVGQFAQRNWLRRRIEKLSADELADLFPAFERLFNNRENR